MPKGAALSVAIVGGPVEARRVLVNARGDRRNCKALVSRLLPGLELEAPETETPQGHFALRGAVRSVNGASTRSVHASPGERSFGVLLHRTNGHSVEERQRVGVSAEFWPRLQRLEQRWLGSTGQVLLVGVRADCLTIKGVTMELPAPDLGDTVREAGSDLKLFAPGTVATSVQPFPGMSCDAELALRLKPTEVEAARAALALGYYENPRLSTMDDIAGALGISKSAVYHRMHGLEQKAVRRLLQTYGSLAPPE